MIQQEFPGMPKKPRPLKNCEEVEKLFKKFLVEELDNIYPDEDNSDIAETLFEEIVLYKETDGYRLAKKIDDKFYSESDSEIVEIFGNFDWKLTEIYRSVLKDWVIGQNIECPFSIGEIVQFEFNFSEFILGEVVKIIENEAKVSVYCKSLGHIRSGESLGNSGCGTTGVILNYEDVTRPD